MQISVPINKVLLEYSHSHLFRDCCDCCRNNHRADELWEGSPAKSKIFTIWPFPEKSIPGGGGASALSEIRKKSYTTIKLSNPWWGKTEDFDKTDTIFTQSHLYVEWQGSKFTSHTQAAVKLGPSPSWMRQQIGQSWLRNAGLPRVSSPLFHIAPPWLPRSLPVLHHMTPR